MCGDKPSKQVVIDGVAVDNLTMAEAVEVVDRHAGEGKGLLVVTPNVDHLYHLRRDEEFRKAYNRAGLVLADGSSLVWLAWVKGTPLKMKIPGVDFMIEYCRVAAKRGRRVFFLGGLGDVAERSMRAMQQRFPGLIAAGALSPSMGFENRPEETEKILERIRERRAEVLFVAAGTPKQEIWLQRHERQLSTIVRVGVGASFEFVSGRIPRAPKWMRHIGLEWLWRLAHEPRRLFRRYVIEDFPFFLVLMARGLGYRLFRGFRQRARSERGQSCPRPFPEQGRPTGHNTTDSAGTD